MFINTRILYSKDSLNNSITIRAYTYLFKSIVYNINYKKL